MRDGIVGSDAFRAVNVKRPNTRMDWNLQQVGGVGRIPSTNDQNEVKTKFFSILHQLVYGVLSFLWFEEVRK